MIVYDSDEITITKITAFNHKNKHSKWHSVHECVNELFNIFNFHFVFRRLTEGLACIMKDGFPDQIKYAVHCARSLHVETPDQQAMKIVEVIVTYLQE